MRFAFLKYRIAIISGELTSCRVLNLNMIKFTRVMKSAHKDDLMRRSSIRNNILHHVRSAEPFLGKL